MKKAFLVVALFLAGAATQTMANHQSNANRNLIHQNRCKAADAIKFVEEGVIYTIATDGSFTYESLRGPGKSYRGDRQGKFKKRRAKHLKRRNHRAFVTTDRWGRVRSINDTFITYQRNGKVRTIGNVALQYRRGLLTQIGNMQLVYTRHGSLRNTIGHINKFNRKFWHDDWYVYNDRYDDDDFGRRIRRK